MNTLLIKASPISIEEVIKKYARKKAQEFFPSPVLADRDRDRVGKAGDGV